MTTTTTPEQRKASRYEIPAEAARREVRAWYPGGIDDKLAPISSAHTLGVIAQEATAADELSFSGTASDLHGAEQHAAAVAAHTARVVEVANHLRGRWGYNRHQACADALVGLAWAALDRAEGRVVEVLLREQ